jgi:hypothetical protein
MKRAAMVTPVAKVDWRARWERMKAETIADAHYRMMRDQSMQPYYLYIIPAKDGAWGRFVVNVAAQTPEGCTDVYRIPNTLTLSQLHQWLDRFADALPMIGEA